MNRKHVKYELFSYKFSDVFLIYYLFQCFVTFYVVLSESEKMCDGGNVASGTRSKKHLISTVSYCYSCISD